MTIEQIEGNEPIHENWGTALGEEIDEVSRFHLTDYLVCNVIVLLDW